jgi:tRNA 2-thiouridine synthesizing protein B
MGSSRRFGTSTLSSFFEVTQLADVFLLTKAPSTSRSVLCFKLMKHSKNAKLYLAGDGVYHLIKASGLALPSERTVACKEDILARGLDLTEDIAIPDDFYRQLIEDIMENSDRIYVF